MPCSGSARSYVGANNQSATPLFMQVAGHCLRRVSAGPVSAYRHTLLACALGNEGTGGHGPASGCQISYAFSWRRESAEAGRQPLAVPPLRCRRRRRPPGPTAKPRGEGLRSRQEASGEGRVRHPASRIDAPVLRYTRNMEQECQDRFIRGETFPMQVPATQVSEPAIPVRKPYSRLSDILALLHSIAGTDTKADPLPRCGVIRSKVVGRSRGALEGIFS